MANYKKFIDGVEVPIIKSTEFSLNSSQILNLNTTPLGIINAPGVGKYIEILSAQFKYFHNTSAYSTTSDIFLGTNTVSNQAILFCGQVVIEQTTTQIEYFRFRDNGSFNPSIGENSNIVLFMDSDPTGGDGTGKVYITYLIKDA